MTVEESDMAESLCKRNIAELPRSVAVAIALLCILAVFSMPCGAAVVTDRTNADRIGQFAKEASLVALVEITAVRPDAQPEAPAKTTRRETSRAMLAEARPVEVFKGDVAGEFILIEFTESDMAIMPPPVSFKTGDRRVVFLKHSASADRFAPLTANSGSEAPTDALLSRLRADAAQPGAKRGKVSASIDAGKEAVFPPGGARVSIVIKNQSGGAFRMYENIEGAVVISVRGKDGREIPAKSGVTASPKGGTFLLHHGHSLTAEIDLSAMFEINEPGEYTVAARVELPAPPSGGEPPSLSAPPRSISISGKNP
jgi:hypothetical protein